MRGFILLATFLLALSAAPRAHAYETSGNPTRSDIALATDYTKVARGLGNVQLASIKRTPQALVVTYLPKGETDATWSQRILVQFGGAPADPAAHEEAVAKAIANWQDRLDNKMKSPVIYREISFQAMEKPATPPATAPLHGAVFQYLTGEGPTQQDSAGIIHAFPRPAGIVLLQLQKRRDLHITDDDVQHLHAILNWALTSLNAPSAPKTDSKAKAR